MLTEAWRYGVKADKGPQWPEPYRFILGSVAMGFAAIVAQFNPRVGGLLAWGLFLGAVVQQAGPKKTASTNSAPQQSIVTANSTTQQPTFQV
jgi:hypothetical protein